MPSRASTKGKGVGRAAGFTDPVRLWPWVERVQAEWVEAHGGATKVIGELISAAMAAEGKNTMVHKDGHSNKAGGCCCPECGNTCGFHPEWNRGSRLVNKLPDYKFVQQELDEADKHLDKLKRGDEHRKGK